MVDLSLSVRTATPARRALVAVAAAVVLWATSSLFVRAGHADPLVFTTWRLWMALPPLALVIALRARRGVPIVMRAPGVSRATWVLVIAGAGAFFASGAVTAFAALGKTRLLDVTLIAALQPVFIMAIAVAFLGEHVDRPNVVRAVVAVAATVAVTASASGSGAWSLSGELIAILSLFLNTGWFLYGRVLRDRYAVDPFAFMLSVLFAAALFMTPAALASGGGARLSPAAFGYAAATMAVGTSAHVLVVWAHRFLAASVSAPLILAQPAIVAVAAWVFFGESLGPLAVAGSAVVLVALWGMVRSPAVEHVEDSSADPAPPA